MSICISGLCEAHEHVRITKPVVPCLSHDPVAARLAFTVIVSRVWYKHSRPGDGRCETVLLDHPIAVYVCVCVYPCIISAYGSI